VVEPCSELVTTTENWSELCARTVPREQRRNLSRSIAFLMITRGGGSVATFSGALRLYAVLSVSVWFWQKFNKEV
jgi:hypothetical protein